VKINEEIKETLKKNYKIDVDKFNNVDELLLCIDDELLKYYDDDYELQEKGVILQKIYDKIYYESAK
jgi:hypothetical protein